MWKLKRLETARDQPETTTLTLTKESENQLRNTQRAMERSMIGVRYAQIHNDKSMGSTERTAVSKMEQGGSHRENDRIALDANHH